MDIIIKSSKCNYVSGTLEDNILDIEGNYEELLNEIFFFTIYETDNNSEKEIGTIKMTYMDISMAEEIGYSTADLFDLIDSEKQGVQHYLFDEYDIPNSNYIGNQLDIIYIDEIFIKKKYRNKGIGSEIIYRLPELIKNMFKLKIGCLVLLANPIESKKGKLIGIRDKDKIEHLISFYEKLGFDRIEKTQYLVKKIEDF